MSLSHNSDEFQRDLKREIEKERRKQRAFTKAIIFDTFKEIIFGSPVDTGTFRASHNISFGDVDTSVAEKRKGQSSVPQGGAEAGQLEKGLAAIKGKRLTGTDVTVIISNNLAYAQAIEDGHSLQSPEPLYGIAEVNAKARIAAAS